MVMFALGSILNMLRTSSKKLKVVGVGVNVVSSLDIIDESLVGFDIVFLLAPVNVSKEFNTSLKKLTSSPLVVSSDGKVISVVSFVVVVVVAFVADLVVVVFVINVVVVVVIVVIAVVEVVVIIEVFEVFVDVAVVVVVVVVVIVAVVVFGVVVVVVVVVVAVAVIVDIVVEIVVVVEVVVVVIVDVIVVVVAVVVNVVVVNVVVVKLVVVVLVFVVVEVDFEDASIEISKSGIRLLSVDDDISCTKVLGMVVCAEDVSVVEGVSVTDDTGIRTSKSCTTLSKVVVAVVVVIVVFIVLVVVAVVDVVVEVVVFIFAVVAVVAVIEVVVVVDVVVVTDAVVVDVVEVTMFVVVADVFEDASIEISKSGIKLSLVDDDIFCLKLLGIVVCVLDVSVAERISVIDSTGIRTSKNAILFSKVVDVEEAVIVEDVIGAVVVKVVDLVAVLDVVVVEEAEVAVPVVVVVAFEEVSISKSGIRLSSVDDDKLCSFVLGGFSVIDSTGILTSKNDILLSKVVVAVVVVIVVVVVFVVVVVEVVVIEVIGVVDVVVVVDAAVVVVVDVVEVRMLVDVADVFEDVSIEISKSGIRLSSVDDDIFCSIVLGMVVCAEDVSVAEGISVTDSTGIRTSKNDILSFIVELFSGLVVDGSRGISKSVLRFSLVDVISTGCSKLVTRIFS